VIRFIVTFLMMMGMSCLTRADALDLLKAELAARVGVIAVLLYLHRSD
jgi:hypothetical protein